MVLTRAARRARRLRLARTRVEASALASPPAWVSITAVIVPLCVARRATIEKALFGGNAQQMSGGCGGTATVRLVVAAPEPLQLIVWPVKTWPSEQPLSSVTLS